MHSYRSWSVFSRSLCLLTTLLSTQATAVVNIDKTRIIFNADEIAQSVNLANSMNSPAVLQIWTDDGDIHALPETSKTPVIALPPILKMQPGELRALKLMLTSRMVLTPGKETLYWLNIYQIPAQTKMENSLNQKVVMPLRLRLKVFVRPTGLGAPQPEDVQKLRFIQQGKELKITNPTPWYMSLNIHTGKEMLKNIMVEPRGSVSVPFHSSFRPGDTMTYDVIDDSGNTTRYASTMSQATP